MKDILNGKVKYGIIGICFSLIYFMYHLSNKIERNTEAFFETARAVEQLSAEVVKLTETTQRQTDKITQILIYYQNNGKKQ